MLFTELNSILSLTMADAFTNWPQAERIEKAVKAH